MKYRNCCLVTTLWVFSEPALLEGKQRDGGWRSWPGHECCCVNTQSLLAASWSILFVLGQSFPSWLEPCTSRGLFIRRTTGALENHGCDLQTMAGMTSDSVQETMPVCALPEAIKQLTQISYFSWSQGLWKEEHLVSSAGPARSTCCRSQILNSLGPFILLS